MTEFTESSEELVPEPGELEPVGGLAPELEEESVVKLSEPSRELAIRLLSKVSFQERITGVSSSPGPGDDGISLFSFEEAAGFLEVEDLSGEGWVCSIDFEALKKWVGETLGDKELAQAIGETTKELDNCTQPHKRYFKGLELIMPVKKLMGQRLKQCKEIIGGETEA